MNIEKLANIIVERLVILVISIFNEVDYGTSFNNEQSSEASILSPKAYDSATTGHFPFAPFSSMKHKSKDTVGVLPLIIFSHGFNKII